MLPITIWLTFAGLKFALADTATINPFAADVFCLTNWPTLNPFVPIVPGVTARVIV